MAKASSYKQNPALKELEVLIGDWEMELSGRSLLMAQHGITTLTLHTQG